MFTTEKMEQIRVVFSERDVDRVVDAVVREGTLQIVDAAEVENWAQNLSRAGTGEETGELRARRERVEQLLKGLSLSDRIDGVVPAEGEWDGLDKRLTELERDLRERQVQKEEMEREIDRLVELKRRVGEVPGLGFPWESRGAYSYLVVESGRVADKNMDILRSRLEPVIHVLSPLGRFGGMTTILVIGLKRDEEKLRSVLEEVGFRPLVLEEGIPEISPGIFRELDEKIDRERMDLFSVEEKLQEMARVQEVFLLSVLYRIRREVLARRILKYFRRTERTYLLTGWIPNEKRESFIRMIRRVTQSRCVIEEVPAEELSSVREGKVEVPVQMRNPPLLKPFELLTSAYGVPAYRTLDPTPLLGISLLLMFGMMFGDVGHGMVLALAGAFLATRGEKGTHRSVGLLIFYGGCSSILFGFLFGSIFGIEHLLPTLWVKPMESITQLFKVAIFFGIGMISLAIGINVVNGIRQRDFLGMIFDKAGLLAAIIYWCGIVVVTRMITTGAESRGEIPVLVPVLMLGSVALLFFREPIIHLIQGKRKLFYEGVTTGIMGGIVEILEMLLGFLANTVSFIRVAAFGLAHAGLFMAIFALSDAVRGMAGGVVSALVLVFGNLIIIVLEGLVVTIQAVRLEFYEFFSRFFEQAGTRYRPLEAELRT